MSSAISAAPQNIPTTGAIKPPRWSVVYDRVRYTAYVTGLAVLIAAYGSLYYAGSLESSSWYALCWMLVLSGLCSLFSLAATVIALCYRSTWSYAGWMLWCLVIAFWWITWVHALVIR